MRVVGTLKPNSFFNANNCDRNLRRPDDEGALTALSSPLSLSVATVLFSIFALLDIVMECSLYANVENSERIWLFHFNLEYNSNHRTNLYQQYEFESLTRYWLRGFLTGWSGCASIILPRLVRNLPTAFNNSEPRIPEFPRSNLLASIIYNYKINSVKYVSVSPIVVGCSMRDTIHIAMLRVKHGGTQYWRMKLSCSILKRSLFIL